MRWLVAILVVTFFATPALAEWYEGGTLHNASLAQWKAGSYSDKLATAGDWSVTILGEAKVRKIGFSGVKVIANEIVNCVDEVAKENSISSQRASEMAAACFIMLGL
ncbi:hypothetical protein [Thioclava sp. DLFJ5-1]|uniref:hypothetical protein n=1 Tax=Thioclava sp. DLFJ5-1 TaxID=1915314 RepID=UPI00117DF886|nr:hypothetical protein [Thioclava sp. DLFJ5-1]